MSGCGKQWMRNLLPIIQQQLDGAKSLEEVKVDFCLSILKPLHAQWLAHTVCTTSLLHKKTVICKVWKKAGIAGLLHRTTVLSPEDPFQLIMT